MGLAALSMLALSFAALPATASAAEDWTYIDSYYWRSSCDEVGQAGLGKAWSDYYCDGSGWAWDDYDLYVQLN